MKTPFALTAAGIAALTLAVPRLAAQQLAAQEKVDFKIPRTADGKPDFNGVWTSGAAERLGDLGNGPPRFTSAPNLPRPEPLPYQPWAEAERQKYVERRGIDDPIGRCMMPGVPRTTAMPMPIQFVQGPKQFVILYEAYHAYRVIPFDAAHPKDIEPTFMGDSVARWDGDTLVVDVVGFNTDTWISGVGTVHTDRLHVVERYRFVDSETLVMEATIEDPGALTRPWKQYFTLRVAPGERIREYECIQNNEDLIRFEQILKTDPRYQKK
jgi:hypothetical protein